MMVSVGSRRKQKRATSPAGPTYLSWAAAPGGPWSAPMRLFAAQANETNADTNLAAAIRPDGSVVGIGRTTGDPTGIVTHLVTAADWRDAGSYVGRWDEVRASRARASAAV